MEFTKTLAVVGLMCGLALIGIVDVTTPTSNDQRFRTWMIPNAAAETLEKLHAEEFHVFLHMLIGLGTRTYKPFAPLRRQIRQCLAATAQSTSIHTCIFHGVQLI